MHQLRREPVTPRSCYVRIRYKKASNANGLHAIRAGIRHCKVLAVLILYCEKGPGRWRKVILYHRGSLAEARRCLSNNRMNITVVSAESEYLYTVSTVLLKAKRTHTT